MPPDRAPDATTSARLRRPVASIDVTAALLALLLAAFLVVGASFHATDSTAWFASSPGAAVGSALTTLVIAVLLYLAISTVYGWLDRRWDREPESTDRVIPMRRALRRWLLPTFGVIWAGWLTWLLIHYPGNVDSDTITQLFQWQGLAAKVDHHPWFDTMIFGWFWDIGRAVGDLNIGLFVFLAFQVTATALGMALALTYLGRLGLSDRARWILTVSVAVLPTFAISVSAMSKDTFAGIFWLPFLVLFIEAVRTRGRVLCRPWIGAAAVALAIPLVLAKRSNVYVLVLCVVVLLLIAAWRTRLRVLLGTALILAVTNVLWPHVVLPALGVRPGTATDTLSIPVQQTARTVARHGESIPASERAAIDAVLRYKGLAEAYVPRRSDTVKGRWNRNATRAEKLAYARVWFVQLTRYPGTYFAATTNNTYEYFAPLTPLGSASDLNLERYIDFWLSRSYKGTTRAQIEEVAYALHPLPALATVRAAVNHGATTLISGNLLASKAFYCSWVPLLALGFAFRRRSWMLALATVPLFLNLAVLVAGPIALPRYMVPMLQGSVLMVGLMLVPVRWLPKGEVRNETRLPADQADDTGTREPVPAAVAGGATRRPGPGPGARQVPSGAGRRAARPPRSRRAAWSPA